MISTTLRFYPNSSRYPICGYLYPANPRKLHLRISVLPRNDFDTFRALRRIENPGTAQIHVSNPRTLVRFHPDDQVFEAPAHPPWLCRRCGLLKIIKTAQSPALCQNQAMDSSECLPGVPCNIGGDHTVGRWLEPFRASITTLETLLPWLDISLYILKAKRKEKSGIVSGLGHGYSTTKIE